MAWVVAQLPSAWQVWPLGHPQVEQLFTNVPLRQYLGLVVEQALLNVPSVQGSGDMQLGFFIARLVNTIHIESIVAGFLQV